MGIHVAGTQRGLVYALAPLKGERAPIITALLSRAPAAHVEFRPLQELIWQVDGGLSYNEMPPQSQQLIDQLVPEYKGELREDFVTALQNKVNGTGSAINRILRITTNVQIDTQAIDALLQRYQMSRQILMQYANNYEALAQNFVHVIPGTAPNPGPTAWSRINARVYARLVGGAIYGEMAKLEIRVLPSRTYGESIGRGKNIITNVSFVPGSEQDLGSNAGSDLADVPLESMLDYPNQSASQILFTETTSGGQPTVTLDTPVVNGTSVSVNGVATATTPGATITQIAWNWGDGSPAQIGWFSESHTYAQPGNYTIAVTATDSNGVTDSASASAQISPYQSATAIWVARVWPPSDQRTSGQVNLQWNAPGATSCALSVSPSIQNLAEDVNLAVPCTGSGTEWWGSIPPNLPSLSNPSPDPVQYTFRLKDTEGTSRLLGKLSVYALPSLRYGGGTALGTAFNSLTNIQAFTTKPVLCPLELGCGIDFGLSDTSAQSGASSMKCVSGTAACDGLTVSGVAGWGVLGAVASDYDSLQAEYAPLNSIRSGYTEYLEVRPQVGIVSIDACKAFEGGAGTMPFVQMADSSGDNYYWSPQKPETCENLQAGELGKIIENTFSFYQNVKKLSEALQPLIQNQILDAQSEVQIGSAGAQIIRDLGNFYSNGLADSKDILPVSVTAQEQMLPPMTPCTKDSVTPCVPVWQPIIQGRSSYDITVSSGAALVSLGTNGAGDLVVGHSEITICGLAVPGVVPAQAVRPASSGLVSVNVSPATVIAGAQFTVSGIAKNVTGGLQAGATVQISALVAGSTLPLTTVTTSSNGTFSAVLNAPPVAGSVVITATVQGSSPTVQGTATLTVTGSQ